MEQLINDIYEIIKDYRQDEGKMSVNRIERWIKQFPESDQEFIMTELKSVLANRYFSKETIIQGLEKLFIKISETLGFATPADFLKVSAFIDHQPEGKSQKDFLALLREISQAKFGLNLSNHNPTNPRYFIYLDDLLCTGDTLFKGLTKIEDDEKKGWLYQNINNQSHLEYIKANNAKIIILYFVIHRHNYSSFQWRLKNHLEEEIRNYYTEDASKWVENDFRNINSTLDYLFPIKDNQLQNIISYAAGLNVSNDLGVFRNPIYPITETLFTSKENRIRFENIMLQQGMRLYELAGENRNGRMRPLGYGLTSHKNLGFGTLCFTYRNVPFNTPLVFWYPYHGWTPLFERKFVSYDSKTIEATLKEIAEKKLKDMTQEKFTTLRNAYFAKRRPKMSNDELLNLDAKFLEEATDVNTKYWKEGYMNAPSFKKQFEKLKKDKQYDKFTREGFEAWTKGYGSGMSLLFANIIKSSNENAFEKLDVFSKNILEGKGVGKGSAINTIKLGTENNKKIDLPAEAPIDDGYGEIDNLPF